MIGAGFVFAVAGLTFAIFALLAGRDAAHPSRWGRTTFYALLALSFLGGDRLGNIGNGLLALALITIAGTGAMGRGKPASPTDSEATHPRRDPVLIPALIIPATALLGTWAFRALPSLIDPKQVTLVALTCGVLLALAFGYARLRARPLEPFVEGQRLIDAIGWAAILPQMLASLGAVFALAGVGNVVGGIAQQAIPSGNLFAAVLVYALGMAAFTMIMGNAFAAFPVMAAAIGIPMLMHGFHGNPAAIAAIGMLSGFCGTLMTPMAANFNLVPAALLELDDRYAVIRAQIPTALPLLAFNVGWLYWFGFR